MNIIRSLMKRGLLGACWETLFNLVKEILVISQNLFFWCVYVVCVCALYNMRRFFLFLTEFENWTEKEKKENKQKCKTILKIVLFFKKIHNLKLNMRRRVACNTDLIVNVLLMREGYVAFEYKVFSSTLSDDQQRGFFFFFHPLSFCLRFCFCLVFAQIQTDDYLSMIFFCHSQDSTCK